MAVKVYIDGQEGTTGLKILERFEGRKDIEILKIDEDKRKDIMKKTPYQFLRFTFLCLPMMRQERLFPLLKTVM